MAEAFSAMEEDVPRQPLSQPQSPDMKRSSQTLRSPGAASAPGGVWDDLQQSPQSSTGFGSGSLSLGHRVQSAPLLWKAGHSTHTSVWFCSSNSTSSDKTVRRPTCKPLGHTWRQWDSDPSREGSLSRNSQLRCDADDGTVFLEGCVPHWGKESAVRTKAVLEHELTWAYYRIRRHPVHPQRKEVGDPYLPQTSVCSQMRSGKDKMFQFWRDLRPPFSVVEVKYVMEDVGEPALADGKLYAVKYQCGLDYAHERVNDQSAAGTFNNKITGVAKVRIKENFPQQRPLKILSWGKPAMGEQSESGEEVAISPRIWMPISDMLGERADSHRFANCRAASRRAIARPGFIVPPLQKLLLSTHQGLAPHARCEHRKDSRMSPAAERGVVSPGMKLDQRRHCVFTAAAGFVKYAG